MNLTSKRVLACLTAVMGVSLVASAGTFEDAFEVNDTWQTYNVQGTQILTNAYPGMPLVDYKTEYGSYDGLHFTSTNAVYWTADGADASTIIAGTYDFTGTSKPAVTNTLADQYLQLNTEGCTVTRALGIASTQDGTPYYLDTMIKFAPSEETPTISGDTYKIALFVNASSNLVVRSSTWDPTTGRLGTAADSTLSQVIDPEKWYRLTIEAKWFTDLTAMIFRVRINGTIVYDASNSIADALDEGGYFVAGQWFIAMETGTAYNSVSFQGTGALDDLLFTTTAPTFSGPTIIKLTLAYNDDLLDVYDGSTLLTPDSSVNSGASILVSAKDWYEVTAITADANTAVADIIAKNAAGVTLSGIGAGSFAANATFTATATAAGTITIAAAKYAAGDTAFGTITANANKLATWALANNISIADATANAATYLNKYLLNVAPSSTAALVITSIVTDDANGTMTITVGATTDDVNFTTINGTLEAYSSANLASWGTAYTADVTITPAAKEVTYVVPYTKGAFFKAVIK